MNANTREWNNGCLGRRIVRMYPGFMFEWLAWVLLPILTGRCRRATSAHDARGGGSCSRCSECRDQASTGLNVGAPNQRPRKVVTFDVLWANPEPGSVHVQFLAVDLDTAEVWEPMECKRVITSSLLAAQRSLRKRLKISLSEVRRARTVAEQSGCFFRVKPA
jgi:hypothetical protein